MAYGCATFARRVIHYTTPDKWKSSRWTGKNASKFFQVNSLPQSLRTRGNWKSRFWKCTAVGTVMFSVLLQLPQRLSLIEFKFYDFFSHCSSNQITALILKYQLFFVLSHFICFPMKFFYVKGWPNWSRNVMLQIKMSLKAKLKAIIKPLTVSLFREMVDQTDYYKLINL